MNPQLVAGNADVLLRHLQQDFLAALLARIHGKLLSGSDRRRNGRPVLILRQLMGKLKDYRMGLGSTVVAVLVHVLQHEGTQGVVAVAPVLLTGADGLGVGTGTRLQHHRHGGIVWGSLLQKKLHQLQVLLIALADVELI